MMRWLLLFFITLFSVCSFAQVNHNYSLFKEFKDDDISLSIDSSLLHYFIVEINPKDFVDLRKKYKNHLYRRFNDSCFIVLSTFAEIKKDDLIKDYLSANNQWKLAPDLLKSNTFNLDKKYSFIIETSDEKALNNIHILYHNNNFYTIECDIQTIYELIKDQHVLSAQLNRKPKEETVINGYDRSVNGSDLFFAKFPKINGNNLSVSVKENMFDTGDIDFKNRYIITNYQSASFTSHATTMATLIAGGDNSFYSGKGIAWGATLSSSDFANLLPDADSLFSKYNITVQNNSYGVGIENFYGADAAAYDESAINNPYLLQIFSAGNSGDQSDTIGKYALVAGFANLTGSFKQAKNIITVGSVDSFYRVPTLSSKGPAYDGRIKPELVAYGNDGSSGAAAITSGTALAVQSAYASAHHDSLPENILVKAWLINSADDILNEGPDYTSGYGNVNTYKAVNEALSNHYFNDLIKNKEVKKFNIQIPANVHQLKITLVWNDEPAASLSSVALINDLDVKLVNKTNNNIWLPWILNSNANTNALSATAIRGRDSLNVQEQISVDNPLVGNYDIEVSGYNVASSSQRFYIVYQVDTVNQFYFITPTMHESFQQNSLLTLRWNGTYTNNRAKLEYSLDKGATWLNINNDINLKKKYYTWQTPSVNAVALVRMTISNDVYVSDTFTISNQLYPQVGYYCGDSSLISWSKESNVDSYKVYRLGSKYLQSSTIIKDTSIVVHNDTSTYIAIAPVFNNSYEGVRSYTFDYTNQGTACYISNFLADLTADNKAQLHLFLGTAFNVASVTFQKQTINGWKDFSFIKPVNSKDVIYIYDSLLNGINTFRAVVQLNDGTIITSSAASINYFQQGLFTVFPNPLPQSNQLNILSGNGLTNTVEIFDALGRKVLSQTLSNVQQIVYTSSLAKGIYFIIIYNETEVVYKTKLLIQ